MPPATAAGEGWGPGPESRRRAGGKGGDNHNGELPRQYKSDVLLEHNVHHAGVSENIRIGIKESDSKMEIAAPSDGSFKVQGSRQKSFVTILIK
jgi:hypothetical protein